MSSRKHIISFLILVVAGVCSSSYVEEGFCCPPGQAVLKRKRNPHYCWEPQSNATSFVPLTCNKTSMVYPSEGLDFMVNTAGQLVLIMKNRDLEFDASTFCVGNQTTLRDTNLTRMRRVAVVCITESIRVVGEEVMGFCMVVSAIFLFLTAIIYSALPELRDLLGKSIINLCLSLGLGLAIIAAMKLVAYSDMDLCATRGFLAYFFVISSFFWTNAISIQILLSMSRPSVSNYGWKEFVWYAVYAWGSSAVLTISMAIVNFLPGDHPKPGIGLNHCWFFSNKQQWQYMYSVMTILIGINICIFIYSSFTLWRHSFSSNHVKALKFKFQMTIRLFIVMGLSWIFEMVGSLVKTHIVWEILDVINSLQGVLIFLVLVVFRRRTLKMLLRHGWLDCVSGPLERCLAVGEDEEEVVQHTVGLSLDDHNNKHIKSDI